MSMEEDIQQKAEQADVDATHREVELLRTINEYVKKIDSSADIDEVHFWTSLMLQKVSTIEQ